MWDDELNTAIDDVARQMTEGAGVAGAGLRRYVLARIADGGAPRKTWRAALLLSPIAVCAAIVLAAFIVRWPGSSRPGAPAGAEQHAPQTPPIVAVAPPVTAIPKATALQDTPAASTAAHLEVRRLGPPGSGVSTPAPQLDPIDVAPIAVSPLAVDEMTPASIQIQRLDAVTPITVAPLDITDVQRRFE